MSNFKLRGIICIKHTAKCPESYQQPNLFAKKRFLLQCFVYKEIETASGYERALVKQTYFTSLATSIQAQKLLWVFEYTFKSFSTDTKKPLSTS